MFEWKIVLTVIVTLGIIFAYLGSNPVVSGFFDSVGSKVSSLTGFSTQGNVEFSLAADKYGVIGFIAGNSNFTIVGETSAALKTGNLRTNKTLAVYGFHGTGSVNGNILMLDGKIAKVELPEIAVAVQETIKSNSTFTSLSAAGLKLGDLKIINTTGTLVVRGATTHFSGDIDIVSPVGDFYFANSTLSASGKAAKISLSNGINIG